MRFVVILISLALLVAGPALYMTKGRAAREQRIAALEALERHRVELQAEAARGSSPSLNAIEHLRSGLEERRTQRRTITERILSYRKEAAPSEETLRALAKTVALDSPRLEPLMRPMPPGELGDQRRHVIRAVLRAFERVGPGCGILVRDLKVAREPSPLDLDPAFRVMRVDLTLSGDASILTRVWDSLLEMHGDEPVSDVAAAKLTVPDPRELLGLGAPVQPASAGDSTSDPQTPSGPPLMLVLALDYVVAEVP